MDGKEMSSKGFGETSKTLKDSHEKDKMEEVDLVRKSSKDTAVEFDADFLERNKTLLRTLKLQQEHEDSLKELRTQLFGTPEPLANKNSGLDPVLLQTAYGKSMLYEVLQEGQGSKRKVRDWQDEVGEKDIETGMNDLTKPYRPSSLLGVSKFSRRIVEAEVPGKLKMPPGIRKYSGMDDPDQHLFEFFGAAQIQGWTMPVWCKMFVQTLADAARVWFDNLTPGSIDSFEDLQRLFTKQFSQQRKTVKAITEIHNIKRFDTENLEQFLVRFNKESMQIQGASDQLRISGFCHGVRNTQLVEKLHEDLPQSMEVLMDRARAFVKGKAACSNMVGSAYRGNGFRGTDGQSFAGRRQVWSGGQRTQQYARPVGPNTIRGVGQHPRFIQYTELVKTPRQILATEGVIFPIPTKQKPTANKNTQKYCEYHRDKGHDTDECWILKQEIEKAVKTGRLAHLVKVIKDGKGGQVVHKVIGMVQNTGGDIEKGRKRIGSSTDRWMYQEISFPAIGPDEVHEEPVIVSAVMAGHQVRRIYVDNGSALEIMYFQCFRQLDEEVQKLLLPVNAPLQSFSGEMVRPVGQLTLMVTIGSGQLMRTLPMTFLVVKAFSVHNVILGRSGIRALGAVVSTIHGAMKFPTPEGLVTMMTESRIQVAEIRHSDGGKVGSYNEEQKKEATEQWVINDGYPDQKIEIGAELSEEVKLVLWELLVNSLDVFAWQPADMTGVPRKYAEHKLKVYDSRKPVQQKKRGMGVERSKAIMVEVRKLVEANILRPVQYQTWVANPVMVKKGDGSWRMCIDFKDLNNACPKDCYPLPDIDERVDAVAGFRFKCFLDAYKGYHQIQMSKEDEDKTAFITKEGLFCYTKMPFGLKNAGATYQKLMDETFLPQYGRNLEAYVDDIVIKSESEQQMIKDIKETFGRLREINMRLNPKKCSFGMRSGKFLRVMVDSDGIGVNPTKVEAVLKMTAPSSIKDVMILNGRLVAMQCFLSKATEKSLPFMKVLKQSLGKNDFRWTVEADEAFEDLKKHLCALPKLAAPREGERLYLYLAVANSAVSSVLMVDRSGVQIPIYYVSRVLKDYEERYSVLEKLALSLVHASRKLRRYFQAHTITVLTNQPVQQVLRKPEVSGRLVKWAIELGPFEIEFKPRVSFKGQVLADFIAEVPEGEKEVACENVASELKEWMLHTDGASNEEGCGAGLILESPEGDELTYALKLDFPSSNNEAEYEAFLAGLRLAHKVGAKRIKAYVDSLLIANQVSGEYEAKDESMAKYLDRAKTLLQAFDAYEVIHIPRSKNKKADALSKLASVVFEHLAKDVRVEVLRRPSVQMTDVCVVDVAVDNWMVPIINFLLYDKLPEEKAEARKMQVKALQYQMVDGKLYRRTFLGPLLRCLTPDEASYVIREIHWGICGIHAGPKMVVAKVVNAGYFWPGMHKSAVAELQSCIDCQKHAPVSLRPKNDMIPVTAAWPFQKWGIDIVGPLPVSSGRVKFILVAVDYFTKWVEAKPLAKITGQQVKTFVWEHIVCRFGLPLYIVSDNGKQFAENLFKKWCEELHIKQVFASVAHPQANGQVERINRSIMEGIKVRLSASGSCWADELAHVLWAHRTMPKTSTVTSAPNPNPNARLKPEATNL
ncbi:hypothetical protein QVD17_10155 [Tagetes erecta]|uniref:Uncharacterized protein n=1 Tax=Tagetes erecta TaxID=13708 RepID=A0AAD8P623_TARER|nr:hypothetical protein QVD17_10155 [Tagetes erecta]